MEHLGEVEVDWSDAVVLWIDVEASSPVPFIAHVLRVRPLGVLVAGGQARERFDRLARELSGSQGPVVMTGWRADEPEKVLEDFFWGFFPVEDRFDSWRRYVVVVPESLTPRLATAVADFLRP
ncbi:MAG: hypothetical protein AMXMBFR34_47580 [Myxococcaceae bacterium]